MLTIQEWCVYNKAVDNHVTGMVCWQYRKGVLAIQEWCVGNTGMRDRLAETGKLAMRKLCVGNTDWFAGNTEKVALCVFFGVCIHSIDMNTSIYYVW